MKYEEVVKQLQDTTKSAVRPAWKEGHMISPRKDGKLQLLWRVKTDDGNTGVVSASAKDKFSGYPLGLSDEDRRADDWQILDAQAGFRIVREFLDVGAFTARATKQLE